MFKHLMPSRPTQERSLAWRMGWWLGRAIVLFLVGSVLWVLIYKWVPVPITATMLMDGNGVTMTGRR
jgi:monofunctional biosynthetic peptidoglycan transglycosylase